MDLELAQVRAFAAVLDHRHFGRAAQALNLTQPALSKRVARLEAGLGRLLERDRGGVALTPAGGRFLSAARRMLEIADRAVADVRQTPAPPRCGSTSEGELHPPARLVRDVAREQPDLVVDLSMRRDLARALGALERHELDFAFGNAVWRTADPHPDLAGVLRAVEAAGRRSEAAADTWLPRAARER